MQINFRKKNNPDHIVVDMDGDLDLYSAYEVRDQIEKLINEGNIRFLFNMEKVDYIDSTGVGVFVRILLLLKQKQGVIRLFKVNEAPLKVFKLTMLVQMLGVCDSEEEAVQALNN
jgi:anti-sigma B factor antagonist